MINSYQNSIIAQLLEAITGQINFTGAPTSNIGDILLSILEQTPYDKEPKSVLAELFLKLKDKLEGRAFTPYDKEPKSAIAEILLSILNETEYDKEPNSRIAELLLELKSELESYAELTASGAIANFTTSVVKPLVNLTAYFKATQEAGTPTPQSPKAISGVSAVNIYRAKKNFFKTEVRELSGVRLTLNDDGSITLNGLATASNNFITRVNLHYGVYTLSCRYNGTLPNVGTARIQVYKSDTDINSQISNLNDSNFSKTVTISQNTTQVEMRIRIEGGFNYDNVVLYPQFEVGSVMTDFEPFTEPTLLDVVNLGGTYYGGYVTQDKNGKRELVVTHGVKLFSELSFGRSNNSGVWEGYRFYALVDKLRGKDVKCSHYEAFSVISASNVMENETLIAPLGNDYIYVKDDNYTTVEAFKTANANTQLWYELAEPFTVALPDGEPITAFNGVNNIYNDSGDTSVTYLAKIADNLNATAKLRAEVKAQMLKAKEGEKEIIKEDPIEEVKEPIKDSGEVKKGANKA